MVPLTDDRLTSSVTSEPRSTSIRPLTVSSYTAGFFAPEAPEDATPHESTEAEREDAGDAEDHEEESRVAHGTHEERDRQHDQAAEDDPADDPLEIVLHRLRPHRIVEAERIEDPGPHDEQREAGPEVGLERRDAERRGHQPAEEPEPVAEQEGTLDCDQVEDQEDRGLDEVAVASRRSTYHVKPGARLGAGRAVAGSV